MKRALPLLALFPLAACPSDDPANPPVLWLALDGSELEVRLVGEEPRPF
jgi:hypothetical protein